MLFRSAALGCFISKSGEKTLPFFKLMKKSGPFKWTPEADAAFTDLKRYLASPPILVAPPPREPLLLYLAATTQTASAVWSPNARNPSQGPREATSLSPRQGATLLRVPAPSLWKLLSCPKS